MFSFFTNLIKSREEWLRKTDNIPNVANVLKNKNIVL